ncbi:UDP-glucose 4-epimerase [Burkholderia singularis]|uniref:UDP-glucose 4-epimerase n=1 Tax=Burkholderia singularis TaxID=1503053 RepID=A0A124P8B8_9BURK|nr:hypothetical protein [Burkholderia singularis]KVE24878.1 UDP-glucose 4-epimerase [Burkholderia singularis]SMF98335.1 hypothetical protein BSIN_1627 [Burkholderia singularis]
MTLTGTIHTTQWSVDVDTSAAPEGGYRCRIQVAHQSAGQAFERAFELGRTFATERDAVLEGLRAGMTWIEMKTSHAFNVN